MEIVKILHNPKQKILLQAIKDSVSVLDEITDEEIDAFMNELWHKITVADTCLYYDNRSKKVYTLEEIPTLLKTYKSWSYLDVNDEYEVDDALDDYLNGTESGVRLDVDWDYILGNDDTEACLGVLKELCQLVGFTEGINYLEHMDDDDDSYHM